MKKWLIFTVICLCFAGCAKEPPGNYTPYEPPFTGLTSIDEVSDFLESSSSGQSADDPVELNVKINASEWEQLFQAIVQANKFVAIDISHCFNVPQTFSFEMGDYILFRTKLISMSLPSGIKNIGYSVFSGCTSLTKVDLPASIIFIGKDGTLAVFYNCMSLERIICRATTPPNTSPRAFEYMSNTTIFEVPANSLQAYKDTWGVWHSLINDRIVASQNF